MLGQNLLVLVKKMRVPFLYSLSTYRDKMDNLRFHLQDVIITRSMLATFDGMRYVNGCLHLRCNEKTLDFSPKTVHFFD